MQTALTLLIEYRCKLNEHECRYEVDLINNADYAGSLACLHVDLLMLFYRIQLLTLPISSCIKSLQHIKADRLAQAIFWLQAAICRPDGKVLESLTLKSFATKSGDCRKKPEWLEPKHFL